MGEKNTFAEQNESTNKKTAQKSGFFKNMAGVTGLEPMNGGIKTRCLTNLAIPHQCKSFWLRTSLVILIVAVRYLRLWQQIRASFQEALAALPLPDPGH